MPDQDDLPLLISLSSGTTGKHKGSLVTHGQMYQRFVGQWVTIGFNSQDRFLGLIPLFFGAGRSFSMAFLAAGATVVLDPPPHEPHELVIAVNASRANVTFMVPTQLRRLVPLHKDELLLPGLNKLLISGAALYPAEAGEMRRKVNPGLTGYYTSNEGGGRRRRAIGKIRRDRDGVYHGRRNYHRKRPGCSLPETTGALQGTVPLRGGRGITENVLGETG